MPDVRPPTLAWCALGAALSFATTAHAQSASPSPAPASTSEAPTASVAPASTSEAPAPTDTTASDIVETPPAPPRTDATLRIEVVDEGVHAMVTVSSGATALTCEADASHPCTLSGVPLGHSHIAVRGDVRYDREITLDAYGAVVSIHHLVPRNGVLGGAIVTVFGVLLGAGAIAIYLACHDSMSCQNDVVPEPITGVAVPLAIMSPTAIALGIAMIGWHRPGEDTFDVIAGDADAPVSTRVRAVDRVRAAIAPVPGGAAVTALVRF